MCRWVWWSLAAGSGVGCTAGNGASDAGGGPTVVACTSPGWELWTAGDTDGACGCFAEQDDALGAAWCALGEGDPARAVEQFGAGEGDDFEAGLAVALDLADDPAGAGAAADRVLARSPTYRFDATGLGAADLQVLVARAALLDGRVADWRAGLRALGGEPPNPYDPDSWGAAPTAIEASLAALEGVR